ncbi:hypothetical protein ACSV5T_10380, partial [Veillonella sp. ZSJB6]|uniref:hypothetical protein n=1 Tax=Veillonella sp. ZSJB6 TaxID=3451359 RepID=UPI003EE4AF6D
SPSALRRSDSLSLRLGNTAQLVLSQKGRAGKEEDDDDDDDDGGGEELAPAAPFPVVPTLDDHAVVGVDAGKDSFFASG